VRYEALTKAAQTIAKTATCQPLIEAFDDRVEHVVRHAVELLSPSCAEHEELARQLTGWAMKLGDGINDAKWQIPVTALETLVKFAPDAAHKLAKDVATTHQVWQVRAAAGRIAGLLYDEDLALGLARHDPNAPLGLLEANVRTAAPTALRQVNSKLLPVAAIDALTVPRAVVRSCTTVSSWKEKVVTLPIRMKSAPTVPPRPANEPLLAQSDDPKSISRATASKAARSTS
jgi:hypothetical protein